MNEDFLKQLNDSQRDAAIYCDGAQLVIAGAGSGKTRVLTYKIAYLLQRGMNPWNILALTFTNKAANEMKIRISELVGKDKACMLNMGTFHSVFSKILRAEAEAIGYHSNFTIYDQNDSRSLLKIIIKEMGLDEKKYIAASVVNWISMAKNHLLLPLAYASSGQVGVDNEKQMPALKDVYRRYVERCRQSNVMDFDDLLLNTYVLFAHNDDIRRKYVERFQYVLVDEYQDTNFAQQRIVMQLTKEHQRVCAVGDDAQSIYSFRGANIDNILNFTGSYDDAKLFKLEQNYRSTRMIVKAANSLISHNKRQIPKNVFSDNEPGEKVVVKPMYSDREEAIVVCNDIQRIKLQDRCKYSDFAILYRTNSQSRSLEEEMCKKNIPYRIFGGLSFYQHKEIKDVIAYFRMVVNPDDDEALRRIINYPTRGIGGTTQGKIVSAANAGGVSLWKVLQQPVAFGLNVNKGIVSKLEKFCSMMTVWQRRQTDCDAYTLGHDIIMQSGISTDIYTGRDPEDLSRQENLDEFMSGMKDFVDTRQEEDMGTHVALADFLQEVALLTDLDSDRGDDNNKVSLMTIHSAKGLEFPTVFVVGVEENIFPSPMCSNSPQGLEEERRLLYVAVTRAEKHCILTCAQNRFRYGRMEFDTPSRFISDFEPSLIKVESQIEIDNNLFDTRKRYGQNDVSSTAERKQEWKQNPRPVDIQFKTDVLARAMKKSRFEESGTSFITQDMPNVNEHVGRRIRSLAKTVVGKDVASTNWQAVNVGNTIKHQLFGVGTVTNIEGTGENTKATVQFKNSGTKRLLLKFARFTVVE